MELWALWIASRAVKATAFQGQIPTNVTFSIAELLRIVDKRKKIKDNLP